MAESKGTWDSILIEIDPKIKPESMTQMEKFNTLTATREQLLENINKLKKSNAEESKKELEAEQKQLKAIDDAIKLKPSAKGGFNFEEFRKKAIEQGFAKGKQLLKDTFDVAWSSLRDVMKNVTEEMTEILQSSLLTSSTTRGNVFKYGMSAGQSYAFEKTKTAMGGLSDEDLMYMNPQQTKLFQDTMNKFAKSYDELYDEGFFDTLMEFQVQRQTFQDEIEIELIKLFVNNKEVIIGGMKAIMTIAKNVMDILAWMSGRRTATASDTISNYSSKNINVDTTFNITGQTNDMSLVQAGEQATESLVQILEKGL